MEICSRCSRGLQFEASSSITLPKYHLYICIFLCFKAIIKKKICCKLYLASEIIANHHESQDPTSENCSSRIAHLNKKLYISTQDIVIIYLWTALLGSKSKVSVCGFAAHPDGHHLVTHGPSSSIKMTFHGFES